MNQQEEENPARGLIYSFTKTRVLGEGKAFITVIDGNKEDRHITFTDLKYVPGLEVNLISVDRLAKKNMSVFFDREGCKVTALVAKSACFLVLPN